MVNKRKYLRDDFFWVLCIEIGSHLMITNENSSHFIATKPSPTVLGNIVQKKEHNTLTTPIGQ